MRHLSFSGVFPILKTPFNEKEEIVHDDVRKETEWLIANGVDGIGIALSSEIFKLSDIEKFDLLKTVIDEASGRVPIIMNTSEESTHYTIEMSKRAQEMGASGLMIKPPGFDGAPASYIEKHFEDVSNSVNIPIFMQDQGSTPVSGDMAIKLSDSNENLSYIKLESIPTVPRFDYCNEKSSKDKLILFGGVGGSFFIEELRRGSSGTMPSSVLSDIFVKVWDLWQKNKKEEAHKYFSDFAEIIKIMGQGQGLANWIDKYILFKRGVINKESTFSRSPGLMPTELHFKEIDRILEKNSLV